MKVVLLERVENLGAIGDVVSVKDGFARNFLLPRDKARRATAANLKAFELDRAAIEQRNEKNKVLFPVHYSGKDITSERYSGKEDHEHNGKRIYRARKDKNQIPRPNNFIPQRSKT